mmetsp:Transcript_6393/g.8545  ORF Transcript_6393/g.8545 Transcript_6393/m.8545 type:complete len:251 (+) Transcript_6393:2191-2943(+)
MANSVKLYYIDESKLRRVQTLGEDSEPATPVHSSLSNFDTGEGKVEVMRRDDFYGQVLKELGMSALMESAEEVAKLDQFFAEIGALATFVPTEFEQPEKVLRFAILTAAWSIHGYMYSNNRRLKKINGLNFNMLSVKSIRILNRLSARILAYQKTYERRASIQNLQQLEQKNVNLISAVILVLFNEVIKSDPDSASGVGSSPMIPVQSFNECLVKLQVRKQAYDVPNLTRFLAQKKQKEFISVRSLRTAC